MTGTTLPHPGDLFPPLTVGLPGGRVLHLTGDLAGSFGVVLFYRGARCPYCNAQLSAFQRVLDGLAEVDASILALAVTDGATTRDLIARHGLRFPVGDSADATVVADVTGAFADPDRPSSAYRGRPMAPLPHDQDITSWLQLLSAIEDAEAGRGTGRLTEICLSVYGALAAAQFQVTQLRARVHVLATSGPARTAIP